MKYSLFRLMSVIVVSTLAACGGSGGDNNAAPTNTNSTTATTETTNTTTGTISGSDPTGMLSGTWVSICDGGEIQTATFAGNRATLTATYFLDVDTCTMPDADEDSEMIEFSLSFPGGTTPTSIGTAHWMDQTPASFFYGGVPATEAQIAALENLGLFETAQDIYVISTDGRLYFGDDIDDDRQTRPTEIATDYYYVQQ